MAIARPMPREAPVTKAFRPVNFIRRSLKSNKEISRPSELGPAVFSFDVTLDYTEKLLPQPQDFFEFGLSNVNPRRSMPS